MSYFHHRLSTLFLSMSVTGKIIFCGLLPLILSIRASTALIEIFLSTLSTVVSIGIKNIFFCIFPKPVSDISSGTERPVSSRHDAASRAILSS